MAAVKEGRDQGQSFKLPPRTLAVMEEFERQFKTVSDKVGGMLDSMSEKVEDMAKVYKPGGWAEGFQKVMTYVKSVFVVVAVAVTAAMLVMKAGKWAVNKFRELASAVFTGQRQATGLGTTMGGAGAVSAVFGSSVGVGDDLMQNVATGRFDFTSDQQIGLSALGVRGHDTADMSVDVLVAAAVWAKRQHEGTLKAMADGEKITSLVSLQTLILLRGMSTTDLAALKTQYEQSRKKLELTPDQIGAWTKLYMVFSNLQAQVLVSFERAMGDPRFLRLLTEFTNKVSEWIGDFLDFDNPNSVGSWLRNFIKRQIDNMSADSLIKGLKDTLDSWTRLWGVLKMLWSAGQQVQDNFKDWWIAAQRANAAREGRPDPFPNAPRPSVRGTRESFFGPIREGAASPILRRRSLHERGAVVPGAAPTPGGEDTSPDTGPGITTTQYGGLRLKSSETVAGGAADRSIVALAQHEQDTEAGMIYVTALNDAYHHHLRYHSAHEEGRAFDIGMRDPRGASVRVRAYLNSLGLQEGGQRTGDYWIEPMSMSDTHLHVQFNNRGSDKYWAATHPAEKTKDEVKAINKDGDAPKSAEAKQDAKPDKPQEPTTPKDSDRAGGTAAGQQSMLVTPIVHNQMAGDADHKWSGAPAGTMIG